MAGRPKGLPKSGGRQKGSLNKRTVAEQTAMADAGEMPKDYMLRVMRDPAVGHDRRDRMAGQVAPYVHPRLTSTEVTGKDGKELIPTRSPRDVARLVLALLRKATASPDGSNGKRPGGDREVAEVAGPDSIN